MQKTLGRRIRFFRKRLGLSQLQLEVEANLSPGVVSRIESGQINPTKETIYSIGAALDLSHEELDYITGKTALPATSDEVEKAKAEASSFLSKRGTLSYLLDERWRFHEISDSYNKFLGIKQDERDFVIGKTTAQLIVRADSPVLKWIDRDHYTELLESYLPYYFSNQSHMDDDPIYIDTVRDIMSNDIAAGIWDQLSYHKDKKFASQEERLIYFDLLGLKFPLYYSFLPLARNTRFFIVEYHTKNALLDLFPYLLG